MSSTTPAVTVTTIPSTPTKAKRADRPTLSPLTPLSPTPVGNTANVAAFNAFFGPAGAAVATDEEPMPTPPFPFPALTVHSANDAANGDTGKEADVGTTASTGDGNPGTTPTAAGGGASSAEVPSVRMAGDSGAGVESGTTFGNPYAQPVIPTGTAGLTNATRMVTSGSTVSAMGPPAWPGVGSAGPAASAGRGWQLGNAAQCSSAAGSSFTTASGALLPWAMAEEGPPQIPQAPATTNAGAVSLYDGTTTTSAAGASASAGPSTAVTTTARSQLQVSPNARLMDKLDLARIAAQGRDYWLPYLEYVRRSTEWYRDGRALILVNKAAADAAREALAAHAADPGVVSVPAAPNRAAVCTIGQITTDRAYLSADGNYKGLNPAMAFQKPFSQTTLSCALGPPPAEFPTLVNDFHAAMHTLRSLLPPGANDRSGHVYQNLSGQHLRLRHAVFAPRPAPGESDDGGDEAALPVQYTIRGWPTYHPAAQQALAAIVDSHVARPLPAYDLRGDLIPPSRYVAELRGATVLASFTMTSYNIAEKNAGGREVMRTNICLDIDYLRVLIAPAQFSPRKRTTVHLTDPVSNAAKKQRTFS